MGASTFDTETAVAARGDGNYDACLSTAWDIGDNANGGYAMLPVLRALREESGHPDPLSITTHFLRPIQGGGDAQIDTSLIRRGRSVSMLAGALTLGATQRLTVSAVFGAIVVSLVSGLCSKFIGPKGRYEVLVVQRGN